MLCMARKSKSFRIDERVLDAWQKWCDRRGLLQERVAEAMLIQSMSMDGAEFARLMDAVAAWKATPLSAGTDPEDLARKLAGALGLGRPPSGRAEPAPRRRSAGG
jgi:hypothetical protein